MMITHILMMSVDSASFIAEINDHVTCDVICGLTCWFVLWHVKTPQKDVDILCLLVKC